MSDGPKRFLFETEARQALEIGVKLPDETVNEADTDSPARQIRNSGLGIGARDDASARHPLEQEVVVCGVNRRVRQSNQRQPARPRFSARLIERGSQQPQPSRDHLRLSWLGHADRSVGLTARKIEQS